MLQRFAESPVPALLIGVAVESVLLVVYLQTKRAAVVVAVAIVGVLIVGAVAAEQVIVTDTEAIDATVHDLATAIEQDDTAAVLTCISPTATRIRDAAKREMNRYMLEKAAILSDVTIEYNELTLPKSAVASFRALIAASGGPAGIAGQGLFDFKLHFEQENDCWLLVDYSYLQAR